MSADNGWILRRNSEGEFVLQHYFASAEELPDINSASPDMKFDSALEALMYYEQIEQRAYPFSSGYNLIVKIKEPTYGRRNSGASNPDQAPT